MRDFKEELKRRLDKLEQNTKKKPLKFEPKHVVLYDVIIHTKSTQQIVGWRLNLIEAERLRDNVQKRIWRLRKPADSEDGSPMFEVSEVSIIKGETDENK